MITLEQRAKEIAEFLKVPYDDALWRLQQGFHYNHAKVAEDFHTFNPQTDEELLNWYKETTAYCWELSAYHLESGFNYIGMCEGAAQHLLSINAERVLALGDGVGDLTRTLREAGIIEATYHDLADSKTADIALFQMKDLSVSRLLTGEWIPYELMMFSPELNKSLLFDAVIAWDFFEHLTEVETWARTVHHVLKPGGIFQAQNAFGIGDDEHEGSIPMHLSRNNRFVEDWLPLLESIGFTNLGNGWHQK